MLDKILYNLKIKYLFNSVKYNIQNEGIKKTIIRSVNYIRCGRGTLVKIPKGKNK